MTNAHDSTAAGIEGKAKEVVRDVRAKASEITETVARVAKDNTTQLSDAARDLAGSAKDKVAGAVSQQKSIGADYIGSWALATDNAAQAFDAELPQAARYIRQAADQIQGVANTVRDRDVRDLVGEAQEFARKQPTLFFAGAVVLGFAALRFLKSAPAPTMVEPTNKE